MIYLILDLVVLGIMTLSIIFNARKGAYEEIAYSVILAIWPVMLLTLSYCDYLKNGAL